MRWYISVIISNRKFHENPSSMSRPDPCRRADTNNLTVVFCKKKRLKSSKLLSLVTLIRFLNVHFHWERKESRGCTYFYSRWIVAVTPNKKKDTIASQNGWHYLKIHTHRQGHGSETNAWFRFR
jgi:hypothetical protein